MAWHDNPYVDCAKRDSFADLNRRYSVTQLMSLQAELNDIFVAGWQGTREIEDFQTQIIAEMAEFLESGFKYKWWSDPVDPVDVFNSKIEIVDVVHFYLSVMLKVKFDFGKSFSKIFVGVDENNPKGSYGIVGLNDTIRYKNFIKLNRLLLNTDAKSNVYDMTENLDMLVSSIGLSSEEFSAIYAAKWELNKLRVDIRITSGEYQKVVDGIEDNERLEPLVQAFLDTPTMTLTDLKQSVFDHFYELA